MRLPMTTPFKGLQPLTVTFANLHLHHDRVARPELGNVRLLLLVFQRFDDLVSAHDYSSVSQLINSIQVFQANFQANSGLTRFSAIPAQAFCKELGQQFPFQIAQHSRPLNRSGLASQVDRSACFSRQRLMAPWSPLVRMSGTRRDPLAISGRV